MLFVHRYCQPAGDDHCVGPCERGALVPGHRVERHKDQAHPPTDHQQVSLSSPTVLRIRDVYRRSRIQLFFQPGSELFPSWIRIKEFKYFNPPKNWFVSSRKYYPGFSFRIRIPDPDPDFLPLPSPGVKKTPDPGSGSATLVTNNNLCAYGTKVGGEKFGQDLVF